MLAVALSVALLTQEEPDRLRTICRNGSAVIVEKMPDEPTISVQLWASARSVPETAKTHGWRHLLEHLMARGPKGDVDRRLESQGAFLRAQTYRDAMVFEVNVSPRQLDLAIVTILDVLKPIQSTPEDISKELATMAQEFATYDDASRLGRGAWQQAFGDAGLDPIGTLSAMKAASPENLKDLQRRHFYPENLVLSIAGPVDLKSATDSAVQAIGMKQGGIRLPLEIRKNASAGRIEVEGFGEGRAAAAEGFDHPATVGALAFALAVGSGVEGAFVTYTPSADRGLVIVGQTEKLSGIGLKIDAIGEGDWANLFYVGKLLARSWVNRYLSSASGVAYLRGHLLVQNHGSRPEQMLKTIDNLTFDQFKAAARYFAKDRAVTVVGR